MFCESLKGVVSQKFSGGHLRQLLKCLDPPPGTRRLRLKGKQQRGFFTTQRFILKIDNYKLGALDGWEKVSGGQRVMTVLREVGQWLDSDPSRQIS